MPILKKTKYGCAFGGLFLLVIAGAFIWLKAPHEPEAAVQLATDFVTQLEAEDYGNAYALTMRNGYVGRNLAEFKEIGRRQTCGKLRPAHAFPFQSNGNRIRKRLAGAEMDPPEVSVEFEGICLFRVTMRRTHDGQWKVFYFESHAG